MISLLCKPSNYINEFFFKKRTITIFLIGIPGIPQSLECIFAILNKPNRALCFLFYFWKVNIQKIDFWRMCTVLQFLTRIYLWHHHNNPDRTVLSPDNTLSCYPTGVKPSLAHSNQLPVFLTFSRIFYTRTHSVCKPDIWHLSLSTMPLKPIQVVLCINCSNVFHCWLVFHCIHVP